MLKRVFGNDRTVISGGWFLNVEYAEHVERVAHDYRNKGRQYDKTRITSTFRSFK